MLSRNQSSKKSNWKRKVRRICAEAKLVLAYASTAGERIRVAIKIADRGAYGLRLLELYSTSTAKACEDIQTYLIDLEEYSGRLLKGVPAHRADKLLFRLPFAADEPLADRSAERVLGLGPSATDPSLRFPAKNPKERIVKSKKPNRPRLTPSNS